jgi:hypothetical protein
MSGRRSRRLLAAGALLLVIAGVAVAVVDPFAATASSHGSGVADNASPTGLQTVQRRSLTSQQSVSGTLGYAGSWTVAVPAGTSATVVQQATQQEASARGSYAAAESAVSADKQALATAHRAEVATARQKLAADEAQVEPARGMLASAQQALAAARSAATAYGDSASYTMLPRAGQVIRRGQPLYAVDGVPALLLYGSVPAWRSFAAGMSPGRDVAELNANLRALGYGAPDGDGFASATGQAIDALQQAHGLPETGGLPLGSVAFEPAAVRVTGVTPTIGQPVQPGPIMTLSSTRHDVAIQLDASQQAQVKAGDRVAVTLPDNGTTTGVVSSVGSVATTPSSGADNGSSSGGGNGPSAPTVEVDVRLLHPAAAGTLDQAQVDVLITTARARHALVVPVNALVALAGGGYALEEVTASGLHRLVAIRPGLFDDADGLVQVRGGGVAAGQRVVVPASS